MSHNVFISYKSEEYTEASWVKSCLEENGLKCWMAPDSIPGGSSYADEITSAIENCQVFVLILSQKVQTSNHVKKEIDLALNNGKPILPFMIENCRLQKAFNYYLTDVQRYYAYQNRSTEMKKMIDRIMGLLYGETAENGRDDADDKPVLFDMRTVKTFASCGNESTVFKIKRSEDGNTAHFHVNFEKTRIRDEIPKYAGAYFLKSPSVDVSKKKKIVFEACSPDRSIEVIWVEIKPEGRRWMHESFEFELTDEMTTYGIDIDDFEYPDTTHCTGEITFVIKPISFANEDCLNGSFSINDVRIL